MKARKWKMWARVPRSSASMFQTPFVLFTARGFPGITRKDEQIIPVLVTELKPKRSAKRRGK